MQHFSKTELELLVSKVDESAGVTYIFYMVITKCKFNGKSTNDDFSVGKINVSVFCFSNNIHGGSHL